MENTLEIFGIDAGSIKKTWNKPVLEIISKEVIQAGTVAGAEGIFTTSGLGTHREHS